MLGFGLFPARVSDGTLPTLAGALGRDGLLLSLGRIGKSRGHVDGKAPVMTAGLNRIPGFSVAVDYE